MEGAEVKHAMQWPAHSAGALYRRCRGQACHEMTRRSTLQKPSVEGAEVKHATQWPAHGTEALSGRCIGQTRHTMTHTWCRSTPWKVQRSNMPHNDPRMVQEHSAEGAEVKHAVQWPAHGAEALSGRCRGQACHAMTRTWCRSPLQKVHRSNMPRNDPHMVQEHSTEGASVKHAMQWPAHGAGALYGRGRGQTCHIASLTRLRFVTHTQTQGSADGFWGQLLQEKFDHHRAILGDKISALFHQCLGQQVAHMLHSIDDLLLKMAGSPEVVMTVALVYSAHNDSNSLDIKFMGSIKWNIHNFRNFQ